MEPTTMPIRQDPGLTFAVTATDKCSAEFKVDIPQLPSVVGANVGVAASGANQLTITYSGKTSTSFGVKVFASTL